MSLWKIIQPEYALNLFQNPSIELGTTGYSAVGGSVAQSTAQQRRGLAALGITPTSGVNDGAYYALTLATATAHAFSVDVLGAVGVTYRIYFYDATASAILGTPTTFTGDGAWHRYSVLATTGANAACRLYVVKNNHASTAAIYADGFQCIALAHDTTYIDGDQDGCAWTGAAHASTSTRAATYRCGGRELDFADDLGVPVTAFSGAGVAPQDLVLQSFAFLTTRYVRSRQKDRVVVLAILISGTTLADYHAKRAALVDVVKPDLIDPPQPFLLRYYGGAVPLEMAVVYDSGLELSNMFGFTETVALRLIAVEKPAQ